MVRVGRRVSEAVSERVSEDDEIDEELRQERVDEVGSGEEARHGARGRRGGGRVEWDGGGEWREGA